MAFSVPILRQNVPSSQVPPVLQNLASSFSSAVFSLWLFSWLEPAAGSLLLLSKAVSRLFCKKLREEQTAQSPVCSCGLSLGVQPPLYLSCLSCVVTTEIFWPEILTAWTCPALWEAVDSYLWTEWLRRFQCVWWLWFASWRKANLCVYFLTVLLIA